MSCRVDEKKDVNVSSSIHQLVNSSLMKKSSRAVVIWLFIGVFMVFMQVVIGGITRLTDSGLSITEWEVIKGTLPPLNEAAWLENFEKYKTHARTQYESIHADMTLREFKVIYFWEWFHRLWARSMGFVFLFPFIYFLIKGQISGKLARRLGVVILIAMLAAVFGWIMVKSGLNTPDYAWVNAYKLSIHLGIGFALFGYLLWTFFHEWQPRSNDSVFHNPMLKRWITVILVVLAIQIIFGGWMSGMKAGLAYPTFPDMNGKAIAPVLLDGTQWTSENLVQYNKNAFAPALIQFIHRTTAYLLTAFVLYFVFLTNKIQLTPRLKIGTRLMAGMLIIQFLLGVFTVIACKGKIPVALGVLHQAGALLLLSTVLYVTYHLRKKAI